MAQRRPPPGGRLVLGPGIRALTYPFGVPENVDLEPFQMRRVRGAGRTTGLRSIGYSGERHFGTGDLINEMRFSEGALFGV